MRTCTAGKLATASYELACSGGVGGKSTVVKRVFKTTYMLSIAGFSLRSSMIALPNHLMPQRILTATLALTGYPKAQLRSQANECGKPGYEATNYPHFSEHGYARGCTRTCKPGNEVNVTVQRHGDIHVESCSRVSYQELPQKVCFSAKQHTTLSVDT